MYEKAVNYKTNFNVIMRKYRLPFCSCIALCVCYTWKNTFSDLHWNLSYFSVKTYIYYTTNETKEALPHKIIAFVVVCCCCCSFSLDQRPTMNGLFFSRVTSSCVTVKFIYIFMSWTNQKLFITHFISPHFVLVVSKAVRMAQK